MNPSLRHTAVADGYFEPLAEPAERALWAEIKARRPVIESAVNNGERFREAFAEAARFKPAVDRFFDEVLVMAPDPEIRDRRLTLVWQLVSLILSLADISEIVSEEKQA
jgi:glycyl-tRNA synthetase beta chain